MSYPGIISGTGYLSKDGVQFTASVVEYDGKGEVISIFVYAHKNAQIVWSGDMSEEEWNLRKKLAA